MADPETSQGMSAGQIDRNGEMKMESEKKTETEIGSFLKTGVDYLKALDFEIGSETKYKVKGSDTVNFGEGDKLLLLLTGIEGEETGLVLNRSNIEFLKTEGYIYPRELIGKTLTIRKEERVFTGKFGKRKNIGLFIIKVQ